LSTLCIARKNPYILKDANSSVDVFHHAKIDLRVCRKEEEEEEEKKNKVTKVIKIYIYEVCFKK